MTSLGTCGFVPPYLLQRLADAHPDREAAVRCSDSLAVDERLRGRRAATTVPTARRPQPARTSTSWTVHAADHTAELPGRPVRASGDPESGDLAVDEAATGITAALALFAEVYGRSSYDGQGTPVSLTVHYERDYDNAFWDGTQLVFGDGDGTVFGRFTRPVDVLGHELTHAVTERTAGLRYQGQSGALNESVSDAFASCLKQRLLGQDAAGADWLIGQGIFLPGVQARALRDMAAPGTAYDDPALGRDPQVGHMDDYVDTADDNGGVHLNSGIPNRAFQLAATAIGGRTWEGAGRVWYAALTGGAVGPDADFATFAAATVAAAGEQEEAVRSAWEQVGVLAPTRPTPPGRPSGGAAGGLPAGAPDGSGTPRRVAVRRTGGFAGLVTQGEVELDDDPRSRELRVLLGRIDVAAVAEGTPHPDRYVYEFDLDGRRVSVPEQHLTDDLRRLAELVIPGT